MDEQRGIGKAGKLPWRLSSDLKKFRELTMGHHIIVGRKTYESIGKPLPGRQMIIVTRDKDYQAKDCLITHTIQDAIELACDKNESEVFICGGADIYNQSIDLVDRMYLTLVDAEIAADAFFPEFDETEWVEQESVRHSADERNFYPFTYRLITRSRAEAIPTELARK